MYRLKKPKIFYFPHFNGELTEISIDEDIIVDILRKYAIYWVTKMERLMSNKLFCENNTEKKFDECFTYVLNENPRNTSIYVGTGTIYLDPPPEHKGTIIITIQKQWIPIKDRYILDFRIYWDEIKIRTDLSICRGDEPTPQSVLCYGKPWFKYNSI